MAPLRFCANISWLFTELPDFSQRIYAAAAAGFQAVEAAWLYDCDLAELQRAREATGVEVVLINTPPGNQGTDAGPQSTRPGLGVFIIELWSSGWNLRPSHGGGVIAGDVKAGDLGLGAVPGRQAEFRQGLDLALSYARALRCKRWSVSGSGAWCGLLWRVHSRPCVVPPGST